VCLGKRLPDGRSAVDNTYTDSHPCRRHVMEASAQSSRGTDDACISLCTVGSWQVSLHRKSSYNISHVTDHPQSRISWITLEQSVNHGDIDVREHKSLCDEVTELKADWALDERRYDTLDGHEGCDASETDIRGSDYSTRHCQCEVVSRMDSGTSSLTMSSSEGDNYRTRLKSEIHGDADVVTSLTCGGLRQQTDDIVDSIDDADWSAELDNTQLKLQDTEHHKSQPAARKSSFFSVQCSS